jgi:hypothetical protein
LASEIFEFRQRSAQISRKHNVGFLSYGNGQNFFSRWAQTETNVNEVLAVYRNDPHATLRKTAGLQIVRGDQTITLPSKDTIHRILKVSFQKCPS